MHVDQYAQKVDPHYLVCLKSYWAGNYSKCDEQIRSALNLSKDPTLDLCLYRLWIQISSLRSDSSTLRALRDSLVELALNAGEESHIYFSLIALTYYELDEIDAAHLFMNKLKNRPANIYYRELEFCLGYLSKDLDADWIYDYSIIDYMTLENIVFKLCSKRSHDVAFRYVQDFGSRYNQAKLFEKTQVLLIEELGYVPDLLEVLKKLTKAFPTNLTYIMKYIQALIIQGEFREGKDILDELWNSESRDDAHVNAMIGHCYLEFYKKHQSRDHYEYALQFLDRSILLSEQDGLSPKYAYTLKSRLLKMSQYEVNAEPKSLWLSLLTPGAFAQLRSTDQSQIEFVRRPLGGKAREGDICLMMCEDRISKVGKKVWRLGAIYQVASDVEWDPMNRFQNLLKLYFKPEIAVPIDVDQDTRKAGGIHDPSDPRRFNVYEIDVEGLENICEQVCEELGQGDPIAKVLNELRAAS